MVIRSQPLVSSSQNGVGSFIHQCTRLEYHYCDRGGSSTGMKTFLTRHLPLFASRSPQITHHISPRPQKHPVIRGFYLNGSEKAICTRNLAAEQILQKAEFLRDNSGEKSRKLQGGKFVTSRNESVRGVWSAIHAARMDGESGRDVWDWKGRGGKKYAVVGGGKGIGEVEKARIGDLVENGEQKA